MPTQTWKHVELWYARALGVERNSKTGLGENTPDVCLISFDIEIKHGKQIPKTVVKFMGQAEKNCEEGKVPVVIMHPLNGKYEDGLVMMRFTDWKDLIDG